VKTGSHLSFLDCSQYCLTWKNIGVHSVDLGIQLPAYFIEAELSTNTSITVHKVTTFADIPDFSRLSKISALNYLNIKLSPMKERPFICNLLKYM